jgi:uncharacterized spore protein YtfJ
MAKGSGGKQGKRRSRAGSDDEPLALVPGGLPQPPAWQRALGRLTGARACYGKPIEAHGHVVIPVATLRTLGGLGYGNGTAADDPSGSRAGSAGDPAGNGGGGGGGLVDARPVGFIDIGPDGVRFQAIDVPPARRRASTTVLVGLGIVAASRLVAAPVVRSALVRRRRAAAPPWPVRSLRR